MPQIVPWVKTLCSYNATSLPSAAGVSCDSRMVLEGRLPSNTLLFRADGLHVATVDANSRVQLNLVRIGRDFGSEIEILSGVGADDRVILNPADSLLSGVQVRVDATAQ